VREERHTARDRPLIPLTVLGLVPPIAAAALASQVSQNDGATMIGLEAIGFAALEVIVALAAEPNEGSGSFIESAIAEDAPGLRLSAGLRTTFSFPLPGIDLAARLPLLGPLSLEARYASGFVLVHWGELTLRARVLELGDPDAIEFGAEVLLSGYAAGAIAGDGSGVMGGGMPGLALSWGSRRAHITLRADVPFWIDDKNPSAFIGRPPGGNALWLIHRDWSWSPRISWILEMPRGASATWSFGTSIWIPVQGDPSQDGRVASLSPEVHFGWNW
jgi:hypothetical protein